MPKIPQFIEIKDAGARVGSNFVAITSNGTFSIYAGFYKEKNIKMFTKCIFLIDKGQNLIGLQFGNEELGKGAYTIIHGEKTASINANNIFSSNGLEINSWKGKYKPGKYEDTERKNVYILDLDDRIIITRKPWEKRTS